MHKKGERPLLVRFVHDLSPFPIPPVSLVVGGTDRELALPFVGRSASISADPGGHRPRSHRLRDQLHVHIARGIDEVSRAGRRPRASTGLDEHSSAREEKAIKTARVRLLLVVGMLGPGPSRRSVDGLDSIEEGSCGGSEVRRIRREDPCNEVVYGVVDGSRKVGRYMSEARQHIELMRAAGLPIDRLAQAVVEPIAVGQTGSGSFGE